VSHPPNIVFLAGDCLKASATPLGGNALVPAPFMRRMMDEGLSFTRAYANSPICTPSRASIMTGVHPLVHRVTCHQNRAPLNLPQLPELLLEAGYHTAACGHYELNRNLGRGYVEQCDEAATGRLRDSYLAWQRSGRRDVGWTSGTLPLPAEESNSHLITDRALRMLDSARDSGAPFFLHVSYNDPHSPCFAPEPFDRMVDPASVECPPADVSRTPSWQDRARAVFRTAEATDADLRQFVAIYYGMIAHLDHQMERVYAALAERGLLGNTWIVIASDHGDYTGEKGLFSHTESLYECLLHVPLILVPPAGMRASRGTQVHHLVELVDLFPTMLGMAGVACPRHAQGHDLLAWAAEGAARPLRERVFAQVGDYHGHLGDSLPGGRPGCTRHPGLVQGVRDGACAFTRDPDFGDEAYDLLRDPWELENLLAPGADARADVQALRRHVDEWEEECLRLRDGLRIIPGYRGFDRGWE
jgi:arylsulfatase A-like enzyme